VICGARPRGFDETTVLRRARDRFWSTGFAGASVDQIAAATGLGKGSLYGAFGDKRQLYCVRPWPANPLSVSLR
jgi:AcrR family transcriptional regulator